VSLHDPVHDDVDEAAVALVGRTEEHVIAAHKSDLDGKVSVKVVLYPSLQLTQHQRRVVYGNGPFGDVLPKEAVKVEDAFVAVNRFPAFAVQE